MTLSDDIARIAAQRGKTVEHYEALGIAMRPRVTPHQISLAINPNPDPHQDMDAFDRLPPRLRDYVVKSDILLNCAVLAGLSTTFDEHSLITAIDGLAGRLEKQRTMAYYGPEHPSLKQ